MKICHITSVHIPFDTRIFYKECKSLAKDGYEVNLIASYEKDEIIDSIHIHAVPIRESRLKRMFFTVWDVYRKSLTIDSEIFHFHDPELIPIGLLLKLHGKKVIYDIHEYYPYYIRYKEMINRLFRKPVAWITGIIENLTAPFFDAIVVVTPKLYLRFKRLNKNTVEVCNFPKLKEFYSGINTNSWESRSDSVTYVGSLTLDRGIKEMIQAIGLVQKKKPVRLIIGGSFPTETVYNYITSLPDFTYVDYRGFLSREEMNGVLSQVKAGIVFTHPQLHHTVTYMTKLFEYMSAGIPVIASDFPFWREIIDSAQCGLLVEPMNIQALADAILYILDNPEEASELGRCGRKAIEEKYNWENEEVKLLNLYENLLNKNSK